MNKVHCSCGCSDGCDSCGFNPCAVTCEECSGATGDYAYIYNTTAQVVGECDDAVVFSANSEVSGAVTHTAGTAEIVIVRTGVYLVNYVVNSEGDRSQFTLYRNGAPITATTYNTESGNLYGQFIISAQPGDVLTLVNTGRRCVRLCDRDDEDVVNASITLVRVF